MKAPKHIRDLARELGLTAREAAKRLSKLRQQLEKHKISIAYIRYRCEWVFSSLASDRPEHIRLACGLGKFVEYLDDPRKVIEGFKARMSEISVDV